MILTNRSGNIPAFCAVVTTYCNGNESIGLVDAQRNRGTHVRDSVQAVGVHKATTGLATMVQDADELHRGTKRLRH